jgi:hypothetical protein
MKKPLCGDNLAGVIPGTLRAPTARAAARKFVVAGSTDVISTRSKRPAPMKAITATARRQARCSRLRRKTTLNQNSIHLSNSSPAACRPLKANRRQLCGEVHV